jgi:hypothetical protein
VDSEPPGAGGGGGVGAEPPGVLPPAPTPVPAPPNDRIASAISLSAPGSATADTRGATTESGEPRPTCGVAGKTVWYTLTPSTSQSVTITTEGSSYDTILAVYTGSSLGTLAERACNDQDPNLTSTPGTSKITLAVTAGQVYVIQVGVARGAGGSLAVAVRSG